MKLLNKFTSNLYASDTSLKRKLTFQNYTKVKFLCKESQELSEGEIYIQIGYKCSDEECEFVLDEGQAKSLFTQPRDAPIIYQPLNHKFLFNTLKCFLMLLSNTVAKLNDKYVSKAEMNIRNTGFSYFAKYPLLEKDIISYKILEGEREFEDESLCKKLGDSFAENNLPFIISKYLTVCLRYLTLKKVCFAKYFSKMFVTKEFLTMKEAAMKADLLKAFEIFLNTAEVMVLIDEALDFNKIDSCTGKHEYREAISHADLRFIPYRWRQFVEKFLYNPKKEWTRLKANIANLFIYAKNCLVGLSLINKNKNLYSIVEKFEIPEKFHEVSLQIINREIKMDSSFDFYEYYKITRQNKINIKSTEDKKRVEVSGLSCILKSTIRADIHYSRVNLHSVSEHGYLCVLVGKLLSVENFKMASKIILEDYSFLISNNTLINDIYNVKDLEWDDEESFHMTYGKISVLELIFRKLDFSPRARSSEFQSKLKQLIKQILLNFDINLNILISCLWQVDEHMGESLVKKKSYSLKKKTTIFDLLRSKIFQKLKTAYESRSEATINKIYICYLVHSALYNRNFQYFNRLIETHGATFDPKHIMNIVVGNSINKALKEGSYAVISTLRKLNALLQRFKYLELLKEKTKKKLVEMIITIEEPLDIVNDFLLQPCLNEYFLELIEDEEVKLKLFTRYLSQHRITLAGCFPLREENFFKKYLDFALYIRNQITSEQLDFFKNKFENLQMENEFNEILFQRFEEFLVKLQLDIKNLDFHGTHDYLLNHSVLLVLAEYMFKLKYVRTFQFQTSVPIFFLYIKLNKHCKSYLRRLYRDKDHIISFVAFNFMNVLCRFILQSIDKGDTLKFLAKHRFTGQSYWYAGLIDFGQKIGVDGFEKFVSKKRYDIIECGNGLFRVEKLSNAHVTRIYSLIGKDTPAQDNVDVLNVFSFHDNQPVLNESISTSPML